MADVVYDMKCGFTGSMVRFAWNGETGSLRLWIQREKIESKKITGDGVLVAVRKLSPQSIKTILNVSVLPQDILAYFNAALMRWPFKALCAAWDSKGGVWNILFRGIDVTKYPGHCLVVNVEHQDNPDSSLHFFMTPIDVIRVRDICYRDFANFEGEAVIDSIVVRHDHRVSTLRISGGSEMALTRLTCERLLHTMNDIITMKLAGKKRIIGLRHGPFGVTNQVTKKFAVLSFTVAGWSIPLDWLNTMRLFLHLSLVSQRLWQERGELFSFDFEDAFAQQEESNGDTAYISNCSQI